MKIYSENRVTEKLERRFTRLRGISSFANAKKNVLKILNGEVPVQWEISMLSSIVMSM